MPNPSLKDKLEAVFGRGFDSGKVEELDRIQSSLRASQASLLFQYKAGAIAPETYVRQVNALIRRSSQECATVLGRNMFLKLFGESPEKASGQIDKKTFLTIHGHAKAKAAKVALFEPSRQLAALIGSGPMTRADLTKKVWAYIKKNGLESKRKLVHADPKLKRALGRTTIRSADVPTVVMQRLVKQDVD